MSRDEILARLLDCGAISVIHAIQGVEAGRIRRIPLPAISGDHAFVREVLGLLRFLEAEFDLPEATTDVTRLRSQQS